MKNVLILGCTGSIGSQTLDIIRNMPDTFRVCGLCAGKNEHALRNLCKEFSCRGTLFEKDGLEGIASLIKETGADIAVNGIAGAAGLMPSVLALREGIDVALANKETVVMAWHLVAHIAAESGAHIIPVDSEHSAIFTLLHSIKKEQVSELIITASGGPFREYSQEALKTVRPKDALCHPTWNMGQKITIDSATLANKGLEVIEAVRLFGFLPEHISVVVHPQSLIHSLVRTKDGMLYAQISNPDMRRPILSALSWPHNREHYLEPFTLFGHEMTFFAPRTEQFPLLPLAYRCAQKDASYTIAFNAANEIAVQAFLAERIGFMDIANLVSAVVENYDWSDTPQSIEAVLTADQKARDCAHRELTKLHTA